MLRGCWMLFQLLKVPWVCRFGNFRPPAAQHPRPLHSLPTDQSQSQPQPVIHRDLLPARSPSQNRGPSGPSGEITPSLLFFPDPLPFVPWNAAGQKPGDTAPFSQWIPHRISCSSARAVSKLACYPSSWISHR